ncbi:HD-GYP domain-containing protein [Candidatus Magnetominusculus xianensis]|uniref:Histidine kinase n=1 Tax=Candidatus Magnetominusculus xianensis TaxID=1748249 RepID=A0ABR5SIF8_9BACT|nr:HD domain-containing phosphohydrolase [Candidatus Magnetominusculus xianensis]KWT91005.1 histidine kinase [Candidatus Magnetominusculus xianensis]MBF0402602.1 HD domain-containing protein [Nitrospirota bacterium]
MTVRAVVHYVLSIVIISIYSARVCPFFGELLFGKRVILFAVFFGIALVLRKGLIELGILGDKYITRIRRQVALDFGLYLLSGIGIALYNYFAYEFPPGSGLKVIMGSITLGFYASIDLGLETERTINTEAGKTGDSIHISDNFVKLTTKIIIVAATSMLFLIIIILLIISRNAGIFSHHEYTSPLLIKKILFEILFVVIMILIENINLIISHSKNMNMFFDSETKVLLAVANGDLSRKVTVSTDDEFGLIAAYSNKMIEKLKERTDDLLKTRDVTILSLASLAETRDNETGAHVLRTQRYVKALAVYLKCNPRFSEYLTDDTIDLLYKSAPLHDIGKVGIRDNILLKPGKLTDEEFKDMKMHPVYGRDALLKSKVALGSNSFLDTAVEIAHCHHEKWDGTGYPEGLKGDNIPIPGRLMAVADVYDALITKRVYKDAFSHGEAIKIIINGRGTHFDPDIVDALLAIENEILDIAREHSDMQNH